MRTPQARFWIWPRYVLEVNGKRIPLPPTAGAALSRLFHSAGHYVSTNEIIEAAYFDDPDGGPLTADSCIRVTMCRVRKLLGKVGVKIEGKQGTGFCLTLP